MLDEAAHQKPQVKLPAIDECAFELCEVGISLSNKKTVGQPHFLKLDLNLEAFYIGEAF